MSKTRLTDIDITMIVRELEKWRDGQCGARLTWGTLENIYGYSRQALQAHVRIKTAYKLAKDSLRGGLVKSRAQSDDELQSLHSQMQTLKAVVADYIDREKEWQMRWQRIAYHLRAKGINVSEIDRDVNSVPTLKESAKILKIYDQPLPPNGRV